MESINSSDPFSKYQIGEAIGKGAFGKVFKALNSETGDFCAVKQIEKSIISEKQLPSIIQEIKLLQTLQHVNIVKFIESYETSKYLYFALEFIEGGSLSKMTKRYGSFQEPLLSRYICQVLRGLDYLHGKGVIHRDIKGDNILITKEGVIKLADFGSCTYSAIDRKLTVVGTPFWMAPEVIQMDMNARSTACDIWSLGCTLLELLTGNPPYWELGTMPAMFAMVNDPHPPLPPNISPELKHFLQACFVRDISRRPTASQLLEHPWIKQYLVENNEMQKQHQQHVKSIGNGGGNKSSSNLSISSSISDDEDDYEDGDLVGKSPKELREHIHQLEQQKVDMNKSIKKLKMYCFNSMRENKSLKSMIHSLAQERDQYMIKLGLTPPPPPVLPSGGSNTPTRSALEQANELLNHGGTTTSKNIDIHKDSPSSKHARSSSAPISPPLKISSSSPSPSTTTGLSQTSDKDRQSTSILNNEFFHPPPEELQSNYYGLKPSSSPGTGDFLISSPVSERKINSSGSNNKSLHRLSKPIKFSESLLNQDNNYNNNSSGAPNLGAHFSSSNLNVYTATSNSLGVEKNVDMYLKTSGGSLPTTTNNNNNNSQFGGSLVFDLNNNNNNNINNNGGGIVNGNLNSSKDNNRDSLKFKKPPPILQKESSQKSLMPPITASILISSPGRKSSISSSSDSFTPPRKSSLTNGSINSNTVGALSSSVDLKYPTLSSSNEQSDDENYSTFQASDVPPVESVVVNVQPPRVGDECKVKCGDGWYDALVDLVSGTTFVVTIKPFNIKREVSHSDVSLAPLQFPVIQTKKKSKFNIFGRSSSKT